MTPDDAVLDDSRALTERPTEPAPSEACAEVARVVSLVGAGSAQADTLVDVIYIEGAWQIVSRPPV